MNKYWPFSRSDHRPWHGYLALGYLEFSAFFFKPVNWAMLVCELQNYGFIPACLSSSQYMFNDTGWITPRYEPIDAELNIWKPASAPIRCGTIFTVFLRDRFLATTSLRLWGFHPSRRRLSLGNIQFGRCKIAKCNRGELAFRIAAISRIGSEVAWSVPHM